MKSDRLSCDFSGWNTPINQLSRANGNQTPRNKGKGANELFRRSVSPARVQNDRISASPLRVPLQQAISRCVRDRSVEKSTNSNIFNNHATSRKTMGRSSRQQYQTEEGSSFLDTIKRMSYEDEISNKNIKAHSETLKFLKKYFDLHHQISCEEFISKILHEYGNLWDNQNLEQLLEDFSYKIHEIFGVDGIDPRVLILKTKNDGMLGLIMTIFKQIKEEEQTRNSNYTSFSRNPQVMSINKSFEERLHYSKDIESLENIKNVVQEFMESMYQCMEAEIYNKFNIQMRRMVLKYRQAEKIIKKVNEKITSHADFFDLEEKLTKQKKYHAQKVSEWEKNLDEMQAKLKKQTESLSEARSNLYKAQEENRKLKESMEKLQTVLINKALEGTSNNSNTSSFLKQNPSLSRRNTLPPSYCQNNNSYMNTSVNPPMQSEPFQIKIDTQIIQKDNGQPSSFMTTTLNQPPNPNFLHPTHSPLRDKENMNNHNEARISYSPYSSRFTTTAKPYQF